MRAAIDPIDHLLIIVNNEDFTDLPKYWDKADERFIRDLRVTHTLETPVNFIVYSLMDINEQFTRGRPFFADIARDGLVLYEMPGFPLASPKPLSPGTARVEAQRYYEHWFPDAGYCAKLAEYTIVDDQPNHAAFETNMHTTCFWIKTLREALCASCGCKPPAPQDYSQH